MRLSKKLNDRAFGAVKEGTKKVEIRANKGRCEQPSFNTATPGDLVAFTNTENGNTMVCRIARITLYESVRDLLQAEGTEETLSSTNDIGEGIESIHSIPGYESYIQDNGVFAVHVSSPKETLALQLQELKRLAFEKQNVNRNNDTTNWSETPQTYLECIREETLEVENSLEEQEPLEEELGDVLWDYTNLVLLLDENISFNEISMRAVEKYRSRLEGLNEGKSWSETKKQRLTVDLLIFLASKDSF
jgi:ASC-1-like (ASCH) protein/NTP pyrophosphatase (non-canonical NTP hydrolase)